MTANSSKQGLILFGSPHKTGTTAILVDELVKISPSDWTWDTWYGFDQPVLPCDDCGCCAHKAGCAKSDLDGVFARLEQADVLVFATPVYNLSFSTPLKALIDRTQRYWAARFVRGEKPPIAHPKKTVLLSVAEQDDHAGEMLSAQLKPTLTILNATFTAQLHCLRATPIEELRQGIEAVANLLTY